MTPPELAPGDSASVCLAAAPALFVGVDYDGTLAEIAPDPARATLAPGAGAALARLAAAPGTAAGVFSGRALDDVRARVGLPALCYAGNHGLEMVWGGRTWGLARDEPAAARYLAALAAAAAGLRAIAAAEPGAILEEKGLSLSLHYRAVAPARQAAFAEGAARWLATRAGPFAVGAGKGILEVRPSGLPGKEGAFRVALGWAGERLGGPALGLFVGDDLTDEAALEAARAAGGVAVAVGERPSAAATHHLGGPEAVVAWLAWLAAARSR